MGIPFVLKKIARKFIDSFYNLNLDGKQEIGTVDSWFVLGNRLKNAVVFSGGVGKDITFEMELSNRFNCQVYLFDPSPTGIRTINSLPSIPEKLHFFPIGLAKKNGLISFEPPKNPEEGSFTLSTGSVTAVTFECKKISTIAHEMGISEFELLKIDIEGFEYEVIEDLLESELRVKQIAVEFHDFIDGISKEKTRKCIALLRSHGYTIFHKRGHDYSFVKNDN